MIFEQRPSLPKLDLAPQTDERHKFLDGQCMHTQSVSTMKLKKRFACAVHPPKKLLSKPLRSNTRQMRTKKEERNLQERQPRTTTPNSRHLRSDHLPITGEETTSHKQLRREGTNINPQLLRSTTYSLGKIVADPPEMFREHHEQKVDLSQPLSKFCRASRLMGKQTAAQSNSRSL